MTGCTAPACTARLPPGAHALAAALQERTSAGQPRTSRRDRPDDLVLDPRELPTSSAGGPLGKRRLGKKCQVSSLGGRHRLPSRWSPLRPCRVAAGMSTSRLASRSQRRRLSGEARSPTDCGRPCVPPGWPAGTERPLHRPADPEDQQDDDSGKQQCHTRPTLLVIDETCQMGFWSATEAGKANDTILAELEGSPVPPGSCLDPDRGFQG